MLLFGESVCRPEIASKATSIAFKRSNFSSFFLMKHNCIICIKNVSYFHLVFPCVSCIKNVIASHVYSPFCEVFGYFYSFDEALIILEFYRHDVSSALAISLGSRERNFSTDKFFSFHAFLSLSIQIL